MVERTGSAVADSNFESEPVPAKKDQESRSLIPLGQFRDTFIIAIDNEGVAIIDQHVAHERVLYEQVMNQLTGGQLEGQRLLEPLVIELQTGQRETLADHAVELKRLAFQIESFWGRECPGDDCSRVIRTSGSRTDRAGVRYGAWKSRPRRRRR